MRIEQRLSELKIILPVLRPPLGTYVHAKQAGGLLFLAGKGPGDAEGKELVGKVGGRRDDRGSLPACQAGSA